MTAVLAVFESAAHRLDERALSNALADPGDRSESRVRVHSERDALLGVAYNAPVGPSEPLQPASLAIEGDFVVVADATLYYERDLLRALGDGPQQNASPAQLILHAYRKFGRACMDHLEGDFAFAVWDRRSRQVFCARDFAGRRPLFIAQWQGGLIVSSSLDAFAALPGFDADVNLDAVGADAAGLVFASDDDTCMQGVKALRAGHTARWSEDQAVVTQRFWYPRPEAGKPLSFDAAAARLRELISAAVIERMNTRGRTAVWMSGGRDSTAVFAAGMHALRNAGADGELVAICRSHPPGDSGREDELIEAIAKYWGVKPHWTHAQDTPLFGSFHNRTRWSGEAFAPPYEGLTRSLAKLTRSVGASVALDGYGGDFLFQVSRIYLADLVARGRVTQAFHDWRVIDGGKEGLRGFFHSGVKPLLPRWASASIAAGGRRSYRGSIHRNLPPWIAEPFVRQHSLLDKCISLGPDSQPGASAVEREAHFYLTHPFFARCNARVAGFALDQGVELRSPLMDDRVVRFALSRPPHERNSAGDTKRLLRAAMRGLLPESVLVPRTAKTGTLGTYFAHHMRNDGLALLKQTLPAPALSEAGIVNSSELARAVSRYQSEGSAYPHAEALYCTLQAESWLSARSNSRTTTLPQLKQGSAR